MQDRVYFDIQKFAGNSNTHAELFRVLNFLRATTKCTQGQYIGKPQRYQSFKTHQFVLIIITMQPYLFYTMHCTLFVFFHLFMMFHLLNTHLRSYFQPN